MMAKKITPPNIREEMKNAQVDDTISKVVDEVSDEQLVELIIQDLIADGWFIEQLEGEKAND